MPEGVAAYIGALEQQCKGIPLDGQTDSSVAVVDVGGNLTQLSLLKVQVSLEQL